MERILLRIKQLGPVRDAEIILSPVMLFLGESGLGKSYVAMLCHYIYELLLSSDRFNRFFEVLGKRDRSCEFSEIRNNLKGSGVALRIKKRDLKEWISLDAVDYLRDMLGNPALTADIEFELPIDEDGEFEILFEEEFLGLQDEEDVYLSLSLDALSYKVKNVAMDQESPFSVLLRHVLIRDIFGFHNIFRGTAVLPPARALVITEDVKPKTGLYRNFIERFDDLAYMSDNHKRYEPLDRCISDVLEGSVQRKDGRKYVYCPKGGRVELPMSASAASVRELAPLAYLVSQIDVGRISLLFEEPEAHLHPLKQRQMADVLACLKEAGTHMQITTHSDYLLRRLNELIALKEFRQRVGRGQVYNELCHRMKADPDLGFSTEGLSAYYFFRRGDGSVEISREENMTSGGLSFETFLNAIDDGLMGMRELQAVLD